MERDPSIFETGIEISLTPTKSIHFRNGLRVLNSCGIFDEADYFLYHFFRLLALAIETKDDLNKAEMTRRISIAKTECYEFEPQTPREFIIPGYRSIRVPIFDNLPHPRHSQLTIQKRIEFYEHSDLPWSMKYYIDETGFPSKRGKNFLEQIKRLAFLTSVDIDEKFNHSRSSRFLTLVKTIFNLLGPVKVGSYYYNYVPCPLSDISIALAFIFNWHTNWFRLPHVIYHINEWNFLLKNGLVLTDLAHSSFRLNRSLITPGQTFLFYLVENLHQDASKLLLELSPENFGEMEASVLDKIFSILESYSTMNLQNVDYLIQYLS